MNLAEWGDHVVGVPEALILAALLAVLIAWARWQSRRRFARIQQEFLEQCSRPAILYLYVEDARQNEGKVLCRKGAASPLFDAKMRPNMECPKGLRAILHPERWSWIWKPTGPRTFIWGEGITACGRRSRSGPRRAAAMPL